MVIEAGNVKILIVSSGEKTHLTDTLAIRKGMILAKKDRVFEFSVRIA